MSSSSSVHRRLFRLAAPLIGLNMLTVFTLVVDTAMCGRLPDAEAALKALGFATQCVFLLLVAMMGLTVGTVALVARAHGAGDSGRVEHLVNQSTVLTVVVGVGMGALGYLFARPILVVLGASEAIAELGADYLRPLMIGATFYYLTILYGAICRGVGNTRLPFQVALASNVVNIGLNYGLILGNFGLPALGVQGAAIGTVISQAFNVGLMVFLLRRGTLPGLTVSLRPRRIDGALAGELFHIGFPAALDMLILNASFLSIVGMLGRIDEVAVAAHGIGLRVQSLAFIPGLSISQATGALVGQALGGGDVDRARQITRSSLLMCTSIMSTLALIVIVAAYPIVSIFAVNAPVALADYSVQWMQLLGFGMPLAGIYVAYMGLLQGAGATWTSLRINFASTVLLQIPLGWLLAFPLDLGAWGLWLSFPLSFVLRAALLYAAYRRERWAVTGKSISGPEAVENLPKADSLSRAAERSSDRVGSP